MERIALEMHDGAQVAALHAPAAGERRGGVVLVQEIFGLTAHIAEQCAVFAAQGFEVLAPALFDRERPGLELDYSKDAIADAKAVMRAHPFEQSLADVAACIERLAAQGPVFMVGYCYGGSVTYATACRDTRLRAAACYYGGMLPTLADAAPLCPTIVHLGERDASIPAADVMRQLERHTTARAFVYPAGHGFNSDRRDDYDRGSSRLALERTLALFSGTSHREL